MYSSPATVLTGAKPSWQNSRRATQHDDAWVSLLSWPAAPAGSIWCYFREAKSLVSDSDPAAQLQLLRPASVSDSVSLNNPAARASTSHQPHQRALRFLFQALTHNVTSVSRTDSCRRFEVHIEVNACAHRGDTIPPPQAQPEPGLNAAPAARPHR